MSKFCVSQLAVLLLFIAAIITSSLGRKIKDRYPGNGFRNNIYHTNLGADNHYYYQPTALAPYRRQDKCNGDDNLKEDIGIVSYKLSFVSSVAGLFSLTEFSVPSNNISIISTALSLIFWIPSAVLTYFAWSDPVSWLTGNLVNIGSLLVTLYGGVGIFFGTADIIVSILDEVMGITSLILSSLTTFPAMYDELKELLENVFGKYEVDEFVQSYGCENNGFTLLRRLLHGQWD